MSRGTQTIAGVERALDVLTLFAETNAIDLGVTEIAEQLGLSKAVVHRILSSFRVKGFVELDEDTRRYRIGPRTLTVGMSYLNRVDKLDVARAALLELVEETGETATQAVRAGAQVVFVGQAPSEREIRVVVKLGSAYPLHVGASGKVLLAATNGEMLDRYVTAAVAAQDPLDVDHLRDELSRVRRDGYALTYSEREEGVAAAAAPVRDHAGRVVAALAVCAPELRFRSAEEKHVRAVVEVAERVSEQLGLATID